MLGYLSQTEAGLTPKYLISWASVKQILQR